MEKFVREREPRYSGASIQIKKLSYMSGVLKASVLINYDVDHKVKITHRELRMRYIFEKIYPEQGSDDFMWKLSEEKVVSARNSSDRKFQGPSVRKNMEAAYGFRSLFGKPMKGPGNINEESDWLNGKRKQIRTAFRHFFPLPEDDGKLELTRESDGQMWHFRKLTRSPRYPEPMYKMAYKILGSIGFSEMDARSLGAFVDFLGTSPENSSDRQQPRYYNRISWHYLLYMEGFFERRRSDERSIKAFSYRFRPEGAYWLKTRFAEKIPQVQPTYSPKQVI